MHEGTHQESRTLEDVDVVDLGRLHYLPVDVDVVGLATLHYLLVVIVSSKGGPMRTALSGISCRQYASRTSLKKTRGAPSRGGLVRSTGR